MSLSADWVMVLDETQQRHPANACDEVILRVLAELPIVEKEA
jgi:hypothetical protein